MYNSHTTSALNTVTRSAKARKPHEGVACQARIIQMRRLACIAGIFVLGLAILVGFAFSDPRTVTLEGEELVKAIPKGKASCAFFPDSRKAVIASVGGGRETFLFDLPTRTRVRLSESLEPGCSSLSVSPNGKWIAFGCGNGTVRLWDVAAEKEVAILEGHLLSVYRVVFSPDSSLLASAGHEKQIRVWDTKTKKLRHVLPKQLAPVMSLAFTSDGSALIYASTTRRVERWDLASDKTAILVDRTADRIQALEVFPNGKSFLLVSEPVAIYDVSTGEKSVSFQTKSGKAQRGAISAGNEYLLIGCGNFELPNPTPGYVEVWRSNGTYVTRFRAHDSPIVSIALSPDKQKLVTGDSRNSVKLWILSSLFKESEEGPNPD